MHSIELVSLDSLFILWLTKSAKGISTKSHLSTRQGETNPQIAVIFVVFFDLAKTTTSFQWPDVGLPVWHRSIRAGSQES